MPQDQTQPAGTHFAPEAIIDLDRYPLEDESDPARTALVERLRRELDRDQYCVLPDFIRPAALSAALEGARALLPQAYGNRSHRNCYFQREADPALPDDHPRNILQAASYRMIAADLFPAASPLRVLYDWAATRRFIADIVGSRELFANEDPYQPVNVLCYGEGDRSAWHFDSTNAFTMTLMLQPAEAGGEFEIAPNTLPRAPDHEGDNDRLRAVLQGDRAGVETVPREAGALVLFRGCTSLHRVTPVVGSKPRLMAVFVYETEPGVIGDPMVNETVYGPRTVTPR